MLSANEFNLSDICHWLILILILHIKLAVEQFFCFLFDCLKNMKIRQKISIYVSKHMGLHKILKNLGYKINAIQNFLPQ